MGRPRRSVPRVQATFRVDPYVKPILEGQARDAGVPLLTYLYNVVSKAHGYYGKELALDTFPTPAPMDTLQELVRNISSEQCAPSPAHGGPDVTVRLDEPLARDLQRHVRADLNGPSYSSYLRAVVHLVAGVPLAGLGEQPSLVGFDSPTERGEVVPHRRAS